MPITVGQDSAKTRKTLTVGGTSVDYYSIPAAEAAGLGDFSKLPAALKVVLENMLRFEDGKTVSTDDIRAFSDWGANGGKTAREIAYRPARVLMQDFTGVPAVVDLAAMRDGLKALGGDPEKIKDTVLMSIYATERSGRYEEALKWAREYDKYIKVENPEWASTRFKLARIYRKAGAMDEWQQLLKDIIEKKPESLQAQLAKSALDTYDLEQKASEYRPGP